MNFSDFGTQKKASCKYTPNGGWKTIFSYWEGNFLGSMLYFPNYNIYLTRPDFPEVFGDFPKAQLPPLGPKTHGFHGVRHSHLLSTWGLPLLVPTAITLVISDEDRHHSQGQEKEKVHSQLLESNEPQKKTKNFLLSIVLVV